MEEIKLPEGVTKEMVDRAKEEFTAVKLAILFNGDGDELEAVVVHRPSANTMNQFEKWLDKEPVRAKKLLIKGCLLHRKEIADMASNTELFNAAFDACASMLPVGKSVLKNL